MYRAGISYDDFGKLNMKKIKVIANAYSDKLQEDFKLADTMAFSQGRYMVEALLCTVGNMLGGKGTNFKYPEHAYTMDAPKELTEKEIQEQREKFIAMLQVMEKNFNLAKQENETETKTGE